MHEPMREIPPICPPPPWGRVGVGFIAAKPVLLRILFFQFVQDGGKYRFCLLQDFVVPKPQYGKATLLQVAGALRVASSLFSVLSAVNFDCQLRFDTDEIKDVCTQRLLAAEFVPGQPLAAQMPPEALFGKGHVLP